MAETKAQLPDYYSEGDVRTLADAHAIRSDPKRHAAAKAHAKKKLAGMKAIVDGEDYGPGGDGGADEATEGKAGKVGDPYKGTQSRK